MIATVATTFAESPPWLTRDLGAVRKPNLTASLKIVERCGALVQFHDFESTPLFDPKEIFVPNDAIPLLRSSQRCVAELLERHLHAEGENGNDRDRNLRTIAEGAGRVVSEFSLPDGKRVCLITHLGEEGYTALVPLS